MSSNLGNPTSNEGSKDPSQEKADSLETNDMDWLMMSDLDIQGAQISKTSSPLAKLPAEEIEEGIDELDWLSSLNLDPSPPVRTITTGARNLDKKQPPTTNLGDIDWLILSDLGANNSSSEQLNPLPLSSPPPLENTFADALAGVDLDFSDVNSELPEDTDINLLEENFGNLEFPNKAPETLGEIDEDWDLHLDFTSEGANQSEGNLEGLEGFDDLGEFNLGDLNTDWDLNEDLDLPSVNSLKLENSEDQNLDSSEEIRNWSGLEELEAETLEEEISREFDAEVPALKLTEDFVIGESFDKHNEDPIVIPNESEVESFEVNDYSDISDPENIKNTTEEGFAVDLVQPSTEESYAQIETEDEVDDFANGLEGFNDLGEFNLGDLNTDWDLNEDLNLPSVNSLKLDNSEDQDLNSSEEIQNWAGLEEFESETLEEEISHEFDAEVPAPELTEDFVIGESFDKDGEDPIIIPNKSEVESFEVNDYSDISDPENLKNTAEEDFAVDLVQPSTEESYAQIETEDEVDDFAAWEAELNAGEIEEFDAALHEAKSDNYEAIADQELLNESDELVYHEPISTENLDEYEDWVESVRPRTDEEFTVGSDPFASSNYLSDTDNIGNTEGWVRVTESEQLENFSNEIDNEFTEELDEVSNAPSWESTNTYYNDKNLPASESSSVDEELERDLQDYLDTEAEAEPVDDLAELKNLDEFATLDTQDIKEDLDTSPNLEQNSIGSMDFALPQVDDQFNDKFDEFIDDELGSNEDWITTANNFSVEFNEHESEQLENFSNEIDNEFTEELDEVSNAPSWESTNTYYNDENLPFSESSSVDDELERDLQDYLDTQTEAEPVDDLAELKSLDKFATLDTQDIKEDLDTSPNLEQSSIGNIDFALPQVEDQFSDKFDEFIDDELGSNEDWITTANNFSVEFNEHESDEQAQEEREWVAVSNDFNTEYSEHESVEFETDFEIIAENVSNPLLEESSQNDFGAVVSGFTNEQVEFEQNHLEQPEFIRDEIAESFEIDEADWLNSLNNNEQFDSSIPLQPITSVTPRNIDATDHEADWLDPLNIDEAFMEEFDLDVSLPKSDAASTFLINDVGIAPPLPLSTSPQPFNSTLPDNTSPIYTRDKIPNTEEDISSFELLNSYPEISTPPNTSKSTSVPTHLNLPSSLPLPPLPHLPPKSIPSKNPSSSHALDQKNNKQLHKQSPSPQSPPSAIPSNSGNINNQRNINSNYEPIPTDRSDQGDPDWSDFLDNDTQISEDLFKVEEQKTQVKPISTKGFSSSPSNQPASSNHPSQAPRHGKSPESPRETISASTVDKYLDSLDEQDSQKANFTPQVVPFVPSPHKSPDATRGSIRLPQPSISLETLWQRYLKIPAIALSAMLGVWAISSIPAVQRFFLETGLKTQLVKDASGKNLANANFKGVKLEQVNFSQANLEGANLESADLKNANLVGANLDGANLLKAKLDGARLVDASLVWTNLQSASLSLVDLGNANLTRANLTGAKLDGASFKNTKIELKDKQRATKLDAPALLMWNIVNVPTPNRNLVGQDLSGLNLSSAMLKNANLSTAKLAWVDLAKANLVDANLEEANLTGANLEGANLAGANLTGIIWSNNRVPKTNNETICPNGKKGPCKF